MKHHARRPALGKSLQVEGLRYLLRALGFHLSGVNKSGPIAIF